MRYAILGDLHGNLEALEAALKKLRTLGIDRYLQVGDVVGYGADPGPCIQAMRDLNAVVVAGNHDWAVIGKLDADFFNAYARAAVEWTRSVLTVDDRRWLERLPLRRVIDDDVEIVHATLDQPEVFDYIQSYYEASRSMDAMQSTVCFNGHSHIPLIFSRSPTLSHSQAAKFTLPANARALINVGSVGQPRDEDPRCAFAVYDSKDRTYVLHRAEYDIRGAAAKIRRAGLPSVLAERLALGQ
ncbi:MAG: metallophosphoesterase family protein [Candidatus Saccharimonas sp.]|nr:metallophosphoesterase family protein [Planctomycetaceae bacterium]